MKVEPALKAYWVRQIKVEEKLQKETEAKQKAIKNAAQHEIELILYEEKRQQIELIRLARLGKIVDTLA